MLYLLVNWVIEYLLKIDNKKEVVKMLRMNVMKQINYLSINKTTILFTMKVCKNQNDNVRN